MKHSFDLMMTEHAAWLPIREGSQRVFVQPGGGRWLAQVRGAALRFDRLAAEAAVEPAVDIFTLPSDLPGMVPDLATALGCLGRVARLRNTDLWDAIGTAIIRQVIRTAQAKKLYRVFCEAYGERVKLPAGGPYALFPAPTVVLALTDEQFASVGMAFKCGALRNAATAYLELGEKWRQLAPPALIHELQSVPRIGPWTAHAATADWTNDWSIYPYADLAVRTWAKRAAPSYSWPDDEQSFGQIWRGLAGAHLSSLTLLTLAWGGKHE